MKTKTKKIKARKMWETITGMAWAKKAFAKRCGVIVDKTVFVLPADAASVEAMVEQGADAIHNEYIFTSTGELNRAAIARAVLAANGIKGGAK